MRLAWSLAFLLAACNAGNGALQGGPDGGAGGDAGGNPNAQPMVFGVFGDCRPGNPNDTMNYPTQVATDIFTQLQAKGAQFAIGTGDYMFADYATAVDAQVGLQLQAQQAFKGPVYRTMGNHECTGATASNCPNGNETPNVRGFMTRLLPANLTTTPYYRVDVETPHGTAKFLFVAGNAWSSAQQDWLGKQLADATAYTIIVRHVPPSTTAPGVTESETLIHAAPYTIELLGHFHEYKRLDAQHVISGNGGAPSRAGEVAGFGYLLVEQQANGNLSATEFDQTTGNAIDTWMITPDGKAL
jgi:hypothetical protein